MSATVSDPNSLPSPWPSALIDFRSPSPEAAPLRLAFGAPRERLRATRLDEVAPVLARVDALARAGAWCVGHVRYEAAPAFDRALVVPDADNATAPLASFAVHDAPLDAVAARAAWAACEHGPASAQWTGGPIRAGFDRAIDRIHQAIADGELYQVNYTAPLTGALDGSVTALFGALRRAQPHAYAAFLDLEGEETILSVSPELFFDWRDGRLLASPMKGTAARGASPAEDAAQAERLHASIKERAENLMIVDLLRNDLSRVAQPHSVQVPRLFHTEAWPTVWQMSSDIVARSRVGLTLADVFAALFPCGSVTGAPKVQAMRLIRELEPQARGVYCGAVGVVQPGGTATFNVPIRTLVVRREDGRAHLRCGIGSGITADASAAGEWNEWRHKRAFVDRASQAFELLETLRLESGRLKEADAHLQRLAEAAAHFDFEPPLGAAQALRAVAEAHPTGTWRVRLRADRAGAVHAEAVGLAPVVSPVRVRLATAPLEEADGEFVRFKTTHRAHYDRFAPAETSIFDTLLWNPRGELTEFTRGNLAVQLDGRWLTPALRCGLLDGVLRARLLREGKLREAVLRRDDLERAQGLAFLNSLRGWLDAELIP